MATKVSKTKQKLTGSKVIPGEPEFFIGGLPSYVTSSQLAAYFAQFGRVAEARVMRYRDGKSRGFAFLRFEGSEPTTALSKVGHLFLDGKEIECKLALSRDQSKIHNVFETQKKIFVSNLGPHLTEEDICNYFSVYGPVAKVRIVTCIDSDQSRGFGYITFDSESAAKSALESRTAHYIRGILVDVKPAITKTDIEDYKIKKTQKKPITGPATTDNYSFHRRVVPGHPNMKEIDAKVSIFYGEKFPQENPTNEIRESEHYCCYTSQLQAYHRLSTSSLQF